MRQTAITFALVLIGITVEGASSRAASDDERALQGLRVRRLFESAEKYCAERLADARLSDARRVDLTIELSRAYAEHARESPPAAQPLLWEKSRQVVNEFVRDHSRHPKLVLIRAQGALAALATGEAAREEADAAGGREPALESARSRLRAAIAQLRTVDEDVVGQLRQPKRAVPDQDDSPLSAAQLMSLDANLRSLLARGLREQGLCYPPDSSDRINSLSQAKELLAALAAQQLAPPLSWSVRLDEIICRRWLKDYATAERELSEMEKTAPADAQPQLRAERIHLALARGRIDEALAEAGRAAAPQHALSPQADYARLEAYLSGRQRAIERRHPEDAAEWEKSALDQVRAIEQAHGPFWTRKAETRLARSMAQSGQSASVAVLVRIAQGLYRGEQFDEAVAAYDEAARRARQEHDSSRAFEAAYAAATIEKERDHYRAAIDRYRKLALVTPADPKAAEAHLLAVWCAGQLAQREQPARLDEYEQLLREHVDRWSRSPTTSQAGWWLGRLEEHQQAYQEAIKALRYVRPDDPQFALAVEATGRCYAALLAESRRAGKPTAQLAADAVRYFEQALSPARQPAAQSAAAARAAAVAGARIWLLEIPNGAAQAEKLLNTALGRAVDAPPEWQIAARSLLVCALAAQGRVSQAEELLKQIPIGRPVDAISTLETLAELSRRASGNNQRVLAELELRAADDLLSKRDELERATLEAILRMRAMALAKIGRRADAIGELESLAADNPRDGQTQEELASLLMAGGDASDSKAALGKWREIANKSRAGSPRWFRSHYGLARAQFDLGDAARARSTIKLVESSHADLGGTEMKAKFQQLLAECQRQSATSGAQKK
jgi:hypothetical protein